MSRDHASDDRRRDPCRPDPYRDALRSMSAVEHFGTDYQPVIPDRCLCDAEPGVFTVFTFAVLALHQPLHQPRHQPRHSHAPRPTCGCGQPADTCPVRALAESLLFAPEAP